MQNGNERVGASQWRQLRYGVITDQPPPPIDFDVLNRTTTHDNVWLHNVVAEDDTQLLVILYCTLDVVQVLILLVVTDVPTKRELPIAGTQMVQGIERIR